MKYRIILPFFLLVACLSLEAQNRVEMAIVVPQQRPDISINTYRIIRGKLLGAMTRSGVASAEYSCIVVCPEISVINEQIVESGMRNITVMDIQLNLVAQQLLTNTVFNSVTLELRGEGQSLDDAVRNAVGKLRSDDGRIGMFISTAKAKIENYYQSNTNSIVQQANSMVAMKRYDEALTLLCSYPTSLAGYSSVSAAIKNVYRQYQNDCASQLMQQARAAYAIGNYTEASERLSLVDPLSSSGNEARALCQQIKKTRDAEAARELAAYERASKNEVELEKYRIKAVSDIATAYCKSLSWYYFIF